MASEDLRHLKNLRKKTKKLNKSTKELKDNLHVTIDHLQEDSIETGHYYVQVLDYLREAAHSISFVTMQCYEHVDNNYPGIIDAQKEELEDLDIDIHNFITFASKIIQSKSFNETDALLESQKLLLDKIELYNKKQIKRIKKTQTGTRNSLLYLNILAETKNFVLYTVNVVKSSRDFVIYTNSNNNNS